MDINQLRVKALKAVMAGASQKDFANQYGLDASYLSQILNGHRNLGEKAAANLEDKIGLPAGSLVSPVPMEPAVHAKTGLSAIEQLKHSLTKVTGFSSEARDRILAAAEAPDDELDNFYPANLAHLRPTNDEILIPQYDVRAAMGHGQVPPEYNEAIRNLVVREEVLREKGVTYTSASALAMITGWGQSMEGTINNNDPVIVDRGVNEFIGEGVYVITWHGLLYIKRLQMKDAEHFWLISDNKKNKDLIAHVNDVTIHAKVLLVWNARKL
ncbi:MULTISPECIES: XRE family transcriptional regulator [Pseudomonas]|uniref:XRE family transcriptional regulator n=1 Tax=Pseudomonas TaxID=286 RepID=UPI0018E8E296|nr:MULTISPECIES: XRE family transcriptional regulator [Pseudomonas]MBJ2345550.1 Cro/Cl family transcriptional regulator [Pseudomonas canavaninivorans]MBL3544686.1 Cro/Cl family transcriptional regulator [Pseudomonas sp. HB05]